MALKKLFVRHDGVTMEYWRVAPTFVLDVENKQITGHMVPYVSEETRRDGATPVVGYTVEVTAPSDSGVDSRVALYNAAKEMEFFDNAEDV